MKYQIPYLHFSDNNRKCVWKSRTNKTIWNREVCFKEITDQEKTRINSKFQKQQNVERKSTEKSFITSL
jgi:hypothetical protein